jgi:hypothetical protein
MRDAPIPGLALHLIGLLQTNKVCDAVALCDVIETVDRPRLAHVLAREMERSRRRPPYLIEVNTGEEPQKSGVLPTAADDLIVECRDRLGLPIAGLMCVPPLDEEPALHFALLREIARRTGLGLLSMWMRADFSRRRSALVPPMCASAPRSSAPTAGAPARRRQKVITPGRVLALGGDLVPSWTAPAIQLPESKLIVSASMGLGGLLSGRVRKRNVPPRIAVHQRAPCEPLRPRQPRAAVAGHIRSVRGAGEAPLGAVVIGTVAADA